MKFKVQKRQKIYTGHIFDIEKARLVNQKGGNFWRETVVHYGSVAVIPEISSQRVILVKQFRYPTGGYLWEIPAGTIERGETPFQCVQRELIEETGFSTHRLKKVSEFYTCPGFCTEKIYLYLARDLTKTKIKLPASLAGRDDDEDIKIRIFSRHEIRKMIKTGKNLDAKTLVGLILWLQKQI